MSMTVSVFLNPCVPVRQTEDESSFPLCRWHSHGKYSCFRICRIRKASATHADILMWSKCNTRWYSHVLLYWILFYSILIYFLFVSFTPTLSVSPISPSPYGSLSFLSVMVMVHVCFLIHKQLFTVPLNNSVLMEIFNIACWSPLGAADGLLLEIGILYMRAGQVKQRKGLEKITWTLTVHIYCNK